MFAGKPVLRGAGRLGLAGAALALALTGCVQPGPDGAAADVALAGLVEAPAPEVVAATSEELIPAPEMFDAGGMTIWDGARTLQGVWVAHPLATGAMRVRITNPENGLSVDGALFRRDATLSGPSVLISSQAARALRLDPGVPTEIAVVAVRPAPDTSALAEAEAPADAAEGADAEAPDAGASPVDVAGDAPPAVVEGAEGTGEPGPEPFPELDFTLEAPPEPESGTEMLTEAAETESTAEPEAAGFTLEAAPELVALTEPAPRPAAEQPELSDLPETVLAETPATTELPDETPAPDNTFRLPPPEPADPDAEAKPEPEPEFPELTFTLQPEPEAQPGADAAPDPSEAIAEPAPEPPAEPIDLAAVEPGADDDLTLPEGAIMLPPEPEPEDAPDEAGTPAPALPEIAVEPGSDDQPAVPDRTFTLPPEPEAQPEPQPEPAAAPAAGAPRLAFIQAGTFSVVENATRLVERLRAEGLTARAIADQVGGRAVSRVVIGPFASGTGRDAALRKVRSMGLHDALPVRG